MQPYTFEIFGTGVEAAEVEEKTLTNEKTNEEFSIREEPDVIEVKRIAKKKDGIKKNEMKLSNI